MNKLQVRLIALVIFVYAFVFCFAATAQITIPLQPAVIKIKIDKMKIKQITDPFPYSFTADTTEKQAAVTVYYELLDSANIVREKSNKIIPYSMYLQGLNYVMGTVDQQVLATINYFFQAANWPELVAKMPDLVEVENE